MSDDVKILYGAYVKGAFPHAPKNMDWAQFKVVTIATLSQKDGVYLLYRNKEERYPVGMISLQADGRIVRPVAVWFPWASLRAKMATSVHFVNKLRGDVSLIYFARRSERRFLNHIASHGIVRGVGKYQNWYWDGQTVPDGETDDAMIYQSIDRPV